MFCFKYKETKPMNHQDIIRPKRGSRLLLVSVIAQWFLFLSEDFSRYLSPVVSGTTFALSSTSLSSAGLVQLCSQCLCFSMLWTSLFRDKNAAWFLGAGQLAKGSLPPLPTHPAPHVLSCQIAQGHSPFISDKISLVSVFQDLQWDWKTQSFSTSISLLVG